LVYHILEQRGERFSKPDRDGGTAPEFYRSNNYVISRAASVRVNGKSKRPDVYVERAGKKKLIIEVKNNVVGPQSISNAIEYLNEWKEAGVENVLLFYYDPSSLAPHRQTLNDGEIEYVVFKDDHRNFKDFISRFL